MRFDDAIDGFWLARRRELSTSTVTQYTQTFARFAAYLRTDGDPDFEAITANHVRGWLNQIAAGGAMNKKTQANQWVALSSLWTWASVELGVPHVIRGRVQRPQFQREQPEPYTEAEIRHMLDACDYTAEWSTQPGVHTRRATGRRDRAILLLLVDTGPRASELCNLKIRDFDRKTGRIAIHHGKNDKGRNLYPGQAARSALWRYLQERSAARRADTGDGTLQPHEPLFATNTGSHMARDNLLHTIQRIAQRAGVQHANVHKFRHTFAINFLRNGGNIYALQDLLGHADLETVRIYLKLADRDLRAAMNAASPADAWRL
jgi:integrase/recombinase XerD